MKEAIGGISLFNIVILFVLLFAGYISLSINYSKAYNVKNEIINIVKNQGGVCTSSTSSSDNNCYNFKDQITDYFKEASYRNTGDCTKLEKDYKENYSNSDDYEWVGYDRNGDLAKDKRNAAFCVHAVRLESNSELPNAVYYQIRVFYQLDLPILNKVFNFSIYGETSRVYEPNECTQNSNGIGYTWCKE